MVHNWHKKAKPETLSACPLLRGFCTRFSIFVPKFSNYHLKLEYKWGEKRFGDRSKARRDAGILHHVVGKDGVWPRSVECEIQEDDVGDIVTVRTRLTAEVDPETTNIVSEVITNKTGVHTNHAIKPVFKPLDQGGILYVQGVTGDIRRVIRNPMAERDGWNTVEVIVHGDDATYRVNGKVDNRARSIQASITSGCRSKKAESPSNSNTLKSSIPTSRSKKNPRKQTNLNCKPK